MTTMKNSIHDNANGLDYTLVNDHYLPNLTAAAPAEQDPTGRWGRLHMTCGVNQIYDGSFTGKLIGGMGLFAKELKQRGYKVIDVEEI